MEFIKKGMNNAFLAHQIQNFLRQPLANRGRGGAALWTAAKHLAQVSHISIYIFHNYM